MKPSPLTRRQLLLSASAIGMASLGGAGMAAGEIARHAAHTRHFLGDAPGEDIAAARVRLTAAELVALG